MMDRKPGLAWITFNAVGATEFVDIAAGLGCGSVALLGNPPMPNFGRPVTSSEVGTIRSTLQASDMVVSSLDIVPITPNFDPGAYDAMLAQGAELGARQIGTVMLDTDRERRADALRAFAARARAHGLRIGVEFVSFSPLRSLTDAIALLDDVDDPDIGITFDVLHFVRTGGVLADLDAAALARIGYVQICDGPETMAPDRLMWEAGSQRMIPGTGSFDLAGIFTRLPDHLLIDIEAPMRDLDEQGVPPPEQARRLVTATAALLDGLSSSRSD